MRENLASGVPFGPWFFDLPIAPALLTRLTPDRLDCSRFERQDGQECPSYESGGWD